VQVAWTEPARQDLERIRAYVAEFNPWAANRLAVQLLAALTASSIFRAAVGLASRPVPASS